MLLMKGRRKIYGILLKRETICLVQGGQGDQDARRGALRFASNTAMGTAGPESYIHKRPSP